MLTHAKPDGYKNQLQHIMYQRSMYCTNDELKEHTQKLISNISEYINEVEDFIVENQVKQSNENEKHLAFTNFSLDECQEQLESLESTMSEAITYMMEKLSK